MPPVGAARRRRCRVAAGLRSLRLHRSVAQPRTVRALENYPGRGLTWRCSCQSSPAASSASWMRCHAAPSDSSSRMRTCPRSSGICGPRPRSLATAASSSSARLPGRITWTTIAVSGTRADRSRGPPTHPARATRFRRHRPGTSPAAGLGRDGWAAAERTVRRLGVSGPRGAQDAVELARARSAASPSTRSAWARRVSRRPRGQHDLSWGEESVSRCTPDEASRQHVRQVEADSGKRADLMSSQEREGIPPLRKENHELRCANEILKSARVSLVSVDARPGMCSQRVLQEERPRRGARVFGGGGQRAPRGSAKLRGISSDRSCGSCGRPLPSLS